MIDIQENPFDSPVRLWTRASTLMDQLRDIEKSYFESNAVDFVDYVDTSAGQKVFTWRVLVDPPLEIETIFKDAVSNLRDALDHAVHAASSMIAERETRRTAFPFADTQEGVRVRLRSRSLRDVPEAIWTTLERQRPYKGGNELLYGLNELRNPSTHRKIVPMATRVGSASIGVRELRLGPGSTLLPDTGWNASKKEVELARVSLDTKGSFDLEVRAFFAIAENNPFAGQAVGPLAYKLRDEVARILREIREVTTELSHTPH